MAEKKYDIIQKIIGTLLPNTIAIEAGRIRSKRTSEGHSTKWFAECPNVKVLYSIDHNPMTQLVCREVIDAEHRKKIRFINADSQNALRTLEAILPPESVGFLFLDSANDPVVTVGEFLAIRPALANGCIIMVDDVYSEFGFKGELLLPKFEKNGYRIERYGDYAVTRFETRQGSET